MRSGTRFALLLTIGLRIFYSAAGVVLFPYVHSGPADIGGAFIDTGAMQPRRSLEYLLLGVWQRFDTFWYVHIARQGYDIPRSVVFFPLYPALIRVFSWPLRNPLLAAMLISTVAAFFFFWGLENLFLLDFKPEATRRAVLLAAFWPAAFCLFIPYSDSLLAALIVWSIEFARRGQWRWAGAAGFFAGLTKAAGMLVVIPLLVLAWRKKGREKLMACLSIGGTLTYYAWLWATSRGTPDSVYAVYWNTRTQFPLYTLLEAIADGFGLGWPIILENLPLLLLMLFLVLKKRHRLEYTLYTVTAIFMFLSKHTGALLQSTLRYLLIVFPAYIAAAEYLRRPAWLYGVMTASMLFNVLLLLLFMNWWLVV